MSSYGEDTFMNKKGICERGEKENRSFVLQIALLHRCLVLLI